MGRNEPIPSTNMLPGPGVRLLSDTQRKSIKLEQRQYSCVVLDVVQMGLFEKHHNNGTIPIKQSPPGIVLACTLLAGESAELSYSIQQPTNACFHTHKHQAIILFDTASPSASHLTSYDLSAILALHCQCPCSEEAARCRACAEQIFSGCHAWHHGNGAQSCDVGCMLCLLKRIAFWPATLA